MLAMACAKAAREDDQMTSLLDASCEDADPPTDDRRMKCRSKEALSPQCVLPKQYAAVLAEPYSSSEDVPD